MLLTLKQYQRVYKVIHSIVEHLGKDPAAACIYFSAFGAYILKKHFQINAEIKSGYAAYQVGNNGKVICFGELDEEGQFSESSASFHCWIEAEGWLIDFMAPNFSRMHEKTEAKGNRTLPSYMLQKPLSEMSSSIGQLHKTGDFYLEVELNSAPERFSDLRDQRNEYFAELCVDWYVKPPKKMLKQLKIIDEKGREMSIELRGSKVTGKW